MKMHKSALLNSAAALPLVLGLTAGSVALSSVMASTPAYASCNPCNPCAATKKGKKGTKKNPCAATKQ